MANQWTTWVALMKTVSMGTLEDAIALAVKAHRGQTDKNGQPYILHPLRVMLRLETEEEKIVGILHDVVEDTDVTVEELRATGYSEEILAALDCVTKREGEAYEDFVRRSASNLLAKRVKLADLEDNMDIKRLSEVRPKDVDRLNRYMKAWATLKGIAPSPLVTGR